jgi:hypothetical protein
MIATRFATLPHGGGIYSSKKDDAQICASSSQAEAAEKFKVGRRSVQHARAVIATGDVELIGLVDSGRIPVSTAADIAKLEDDDRAELVAELAAEDSFVTEAHTIIIAAEGDAEELRCPRVLLEQRAARLVHLPKKDEHSRVVSLAHCDGEGSQRNRVVGPLRIALRSALSAACRLFDLVDPLLPRKAA